MKECMQYVAHESFKKALLDNKKKQTKTKRTSQQRMSQCIVLRDEEDVCGKGTCRISESEEILN